MAFKLAAQIEAERPAMEARQRDAALADHAKRMEMSRKRVVITLEESPTERFAANQGMVAFRGSEPGRDPLSAIYFKSELDRPSTSQEGAEDLDSRLRDLNRGDKVSLAGYWAKRQWKANDGSTKDAWEFKAQNFEKGDVPLADIGKSAAARIDAVRPQRGDVPVQREAEPQRQSVPEAAVGAGRPAASPMLSYVSGNIVDDRSQVLVNTVNSQLSEFGNPVMGKGVAFEFKSRFPSIMRPYGDAIRSGELKPGRALLFDLPDGRKWAALATKDHYSQPSQLKWVDSGLKELGEKMREAGLTSIALPPPGCGNGGLNWKDVEPLVHKHLAGITVAMFAKPSGAMEPAAEIAAPRAVEPRQAELPGMSRNAKAIAALGGAPSQSQSVSADAPREWTKEDVLRAIPSLLKGSGGYLPYAGIGSRETPQDVSDDMTAMAAKLEARGFTLRSGFAGGADTAFELGTTRDDRREIFAPWKGFGANPNSPHEKKRWDQIRRHEQITGEKFTPAKATLLEGEMFRKAEALAKPHHPKWDNLPDGPRKMHTRNMGQVFGPSLDMPARFEIAYTIDGKATGGTGQAIRVAQSEGIPVLNMHDRDIRAAVLAELGIGPERAQGLDAQRSDAPERTSSGRPGQFDLSIPAVRSRDRADVASFCKTDEPLGGLAMMSRDHPYEDGGVKWKSSEAQFQAAKFPHNPDLQEEIRNAPNAFESKKVAWAHADEVRPDWREVNAQMLAYVNTRKMDGSQSFRDQLASTQGRDIVELSVKDDFFGAKPVGDKLVGRDLLGHVLTQLRDGARMDDLPAGTTFPGMARTVDQGSELPEPSIKASMYFSLGASKRAGVQSETTFEAIQNGERTSTTRFDAWGSQDRWEKLQRGSVARFYEDREMKGQSVDVVVLGTSRVNLSGMSGAQLTEWSKAEGWSEKAGRDFGSKYGAGVQVRYALPDSPEGREALGFSVPPAREERRQQAEVVKMAPARPSPAQMGAMSDKQKWLSALG